MVLLGKESASGPLEAPAVGLRVDEEEPGRSQWEKKVNKVLLSSREDRTAEPSRNSQRKEEKNTLPNSGSRGGKRIRGLKE